jgi:hypothetical protein
MNAFALYRSARETVVNSVSRAGRMMPRCTARKVASNAISAASEPTIARPRKPSAAVTGSSASVTDTRAAS